MIDDDFVEPSSGLQGQCCDAADAPMDVACDDHENVRIGIDNDV